MISQICAKCFCIGCYIGCLLEFPAVFKIKLKKVRIDCSGTYLLTITIMIVLYAEKLLDLDLFWAFLTICLITNF